MGVRDRVAIVTGSGQGIGAGVVEKLAAEGARVVVNDVVADRAEAVASRIRQAGEQALAVAACIPGTVAFRACRRRAEGEVVLGHPSGTFPVRVRVAGEPGNWTVERASYSRTARRLMEGYAFVRTACVAPGPPGAP